MLVMHVVGHPGAPAWAPPHHLRIVIFIEKTVVLHILLRKMCPHQWFSYTFVEKPSPAMVLAILFEQRLPH